MTTASARFPLVSPVGELDIGQGHILALRCRPEGEN